MNRTTRYVLAELLKVFFVALTGMTLLMILVGVAFEAVRQGLGLAPILRLIPFVLPNALLFAVPGTILFAVCSVYGNMSASNEITAIKAAGASPLTLVWPALMLAFVLSLVTVWLNDVAVSWGRKGMYRVVVQSVEQTIYGMLRTQKSHSTSRFSITVQDVDGRILINPTLVVFPEEGAHPITLTAEQAELRSDFDDQTLVVVMRHGDIEIPGEARFVFDEFKQAIPLPDLVKKGEDAKRPANLPLRSVPDEIRSQRSIIERQRQDRAADAAFQLIGGEIAALTSETWTAHQWDLEHANKRLYRLQTEPWRRWANGFSCLFFVMVGAPLSIKLRKADLWTTFFLCFLPVLIFYYPLLMYGISRAKNGALPPYSVWMGNVVMGIAGIWLLRKILRY
jgi:lipopolysaccharide export system permease protein